MSTANFPGNTAMPSKVSFALRSTPTASCERRSGKPARSWRWPILAVVLGLFAHQGALAQTTGSALSTLTLSAGTLDPAFDSTEDDRTFTVGVAFGVTQVTVAAAGKTDWEVTYLGAADADGTAVDYQRNLTLGTNTITVRATSTAVPPETARQYTIRVTRDTIRVTRAAEIGSALSGLTLTQSGGSGSAGSLDPAFDAATNDTAFTADADLSVTQVTVAATAKPGWDVTYHDDPDADGTAADYQRNLAVGANRITVRATPIGTSGPRNYTITVTRTTTPSAPQNLQATAAASAVRLSWTAPSSDGGMDIVGYDYRSKDADADNGQWTAQDTWNQISPSDDSTTSLDVSGLVNGTTYMFQVRARNANGNGSASSTAEATPAGPLPAPAWTTDPPAVVVGNRRVTLNWTHINDASVTGYQYRRRVGAGGWGGWTTIPDSDLVESGTTRSYTVTGLTNDTTYRFQVRGRNSVGGGAASTEVDGTPEAGAPAAPTNLSATAGDAQVTLSWSAPSDNGGEPITGYEYQVNSQSLSDSDGWTATGGTQTTVTVYALSDGTTALTNGTTYYFRVRAVNDLGCSATETAGCGQASLEESATPFGRPVTRVDLTAADFGDSRVTLMWTLENAPGGSAPPPADDRSGFQYRQKASGGYGSWIDVRNSNASTTMHVVAGLDNGTTYTFQVRAANSSGGGLASNERSAVPSTTPGASTLTATAGDEEVRLRWTPADDGGSRIVRYDCRLRIGSGNYTEPPSCAAKSLGASATSLTLTDDDDVDTSTTPATGIANGTTYTFQVRAVNANGVGDWSNEASARPTDGSERSYTISATIDGKSWAKAGVANASLRATVEVNPRFSAQNTTLTVTATGAATNQTMVFGPTDSRRDASFSFSSVPSTDITVALFMGSVASPPPADALAVTRVEVRHGTTPEPPMGLVAARGDGEVTLSWATVTDDGGAIVNYDYDYRQKRQAGSYGRWTDFAGRELQSRTVTSNTVTGLTDGGTYAFQVRAVAVTGSPPNTVRVENAESDPSDEVSVSLSGTVETGGLSAPRNLAAAAGNGEVRLSWTAPAADGGAAITGYQYQRRAGAGAYGQWTTIPGGSSARSYTATGLTNGTLYYFRVRAVNSDGPGPASTEESATPLLGVDTTLRALSLSVGTLAPAFTPATRIYTAAVGSSVAQVTVTATANKQGLTPTITPADANTTVAGHQVALAVGPNRIRVRVTDGTNIGDYSITVTRAGSVPAAPTGLTATGEDAGGAVTLSWTAPTGGGAVSRYEYQQKAGTGAYGGWTPIPGSGPSTTSYTVTGLTNGTAYAFRVRAVNSVGNGAASNEASTTPALARLVWAKSEREVADAITAARNAGYGDDRTFTAGETIEVRGSSLFNAAEGVSVTYAATSDDSDAASAASSDGTVTVTARAAGMATITITARAPQTSGVTIVDQTDPREASIQFDVETGLEALTLELSGPEDGTNLVEGGRTHANGTTGAVTVTVEANRPVTEDVTVTLLPDRALSGATADDIEMQPDPIVIEAGETRGSTVVTAVEDETAEGMEELVLFGVTAGNAGEVMGEVRLRLWDAAVPALPVIAQLLLVVFLAIGGYRRYRRR